MKREKTASVILWIMGMILCPLGVALCANANFGVSMIEAPVMVVFLKLNSYFSWFTLGMSEYLLQAIVLIIMCIAVRQFKLKYLLSFLTAVVFGFIVDFWRLFVGKEVYTDFAMRIIACVTGTLIISFAVACFFRTWLPQEVWELFVKEFSEKYKKDTTRVKWVYDITSLTAGIALMFILLGRYEQQAVGIATVITTIINAPLIGAFGKLIDKAIKN